MYWKFNADGTYDFYTGSISPLTAAKANVIGDLIWECLQQIVRGVKYQASYRYDFEKKNDPRTGKPTIIVNNTVYTSEDNKVLWK
jgi:hypothetical protein